MTTFAKYDAMKVGELRALCKSRGIDSDRMLIQNSRLNMFIEKKEDLISALKGADSQINMDTSSTESQVLQSEAQNIRSFAPEELRELATIADEMRHLRKQWISQSTAAPSTYRTAQKSTSLNS